MKNILLVFFLLLSCFACRNTIATNTQAKSPITIVIHGGAGTIKRESLSLEREQAYHAKLKEALDSGYTVLAQGGKSVEAVVAAIKILEDSPLFNAGKGAVFTNEGKNELDASIMDGSNLMAGAVAGVTTIKNPITAAHAVMTKSEHVMLIGRGAEKFAQEQGLMIVEPSYFIDSARYKQWRKLQGSFNAGSFDEALEEKKYGTVGCVALDKYGNIAAGTSTGGMTDKNLGV